MHIQNVKVKKSVRFFVAIIKYKYDFIDHLKYKSRCTSFLLQTDVAYFCVKTKFLMTLYLDCIFLCILFLNNRKKLPNQHVMNRAITLFIFVNSIAYL